VIPATTRTIFAVVLRGVVPAILGASLHVALATATASPANHDVAVSIT
jgi:hypothetical protein